MTIGATLTERLAIIVDAHTDGAVSNIRKLSLEEQAAAERATVLQAKITDLEASMSRSRTPGGTAAQQQRLSRLSNEYKGLTSNLANVPAAASRAESALAKVGLGGLVPSSTLGAAGKALPGLAAGALAFGEVAFVKSGIEDYVHLADEIRKVAQAASSSVPDASRLVAVTHALGLNSDSAALGLFRLGKNVDAQPEKFSALGISIAKTKSGNTDLIGTLFNVADAYQHTADASQRAGLVQTSFGRAGVTMLPILNATKTRLEDIATEAAKQGRIFSPEDLKRAQDYQVQVAEMKTSFQSLAITAGKTLVPALTDVFGIMTKIGDATHSTAFNIGKWIVPGYQLFRAAKFGAHVLGLGGGGSSTPGPQPLSADQQAALDAQNAVAQTIIGTSAGAFDTLAGPAAVKSAAGVLDKAQNALAAARRERAAALGALGTAQRSGVGQLDINAAQTRLDAANASLKTALYLGGDARIASARAAVAAAQKAVNDTQNTGVGTSDRLTAAQNRLTSANQRVADTTKAVHQAEHAANAARGLTAEQLLHRITGQTGAERQKLRDDLKLAGLGIAPAVLGEIQTLDQQMPGTLHRVAQTATRGLVAGIDKEFAARTTAQGFADDFAKGFAAAPALYRGGKKAGGELGRGVIDGLDQVLLGHTGRAARSSSSRSVPPGAGLGQLLSPGVTVHGNIVVQGKTARQVAHDIARKSRLRALSSGSGEQHYGWDD